MEYNIAMVKKRKAARPNSEPDSQAADTLERVLLAGVRPYLWIMAVAFLVYMPTLFFGLTYFDDNVLILDNKHFLSRISNIFPAFVQQVFHILHSPAAYYRPLLTVSLIFDAQLGGTSPFIYHFTNIIIHLITTSLVFLLLKRLNYDKSLAFVFALVFAVHPVLTQAVAWIPGRNNSLLAMFVLTSFILFLDYFDGKKIKSLIGHMFFLALAMFTKESALALIPLVLLYLHLIAGDKLFSSIKIRLIAAWVPITTIWFIFRKTALENPIQYTFEGMFKSIIMNSSGLIQFIGKILFPFNLSVLPIIKDTTFTYGILALSLVSVALVMTKTKRHPYILFGAAWFLLFLLPSFIRPNTSVVAELMEHRIYVPIIGFFIILLETDLVRKFSFKKSHTVAIAGTGILALFIITLVHGHNFKDRLTFWQSAVKNSPHSPLAHRNLGAMLYFEREFDQAIKEYTRSLELNPREHMAHNNLGVIYMIRGELDQAAVEYKKELINNPNYDNALFNLGIVEYKKNNKERAVLLWKQTLKVNPDYFNAYENLAIHYSKKKQLDKAGFYINELMKRGVKPSAKLLRLIRAAE